MKAVRLLHLLVFGAAAAAWAVCVWQFCPPVLWYRCAYLSVALFVSLAAYRAPGTGLWLLLALVPAANLPSRALAYGAHEALTFLACGCVLGWWASHLVSRTAVRMDRALAWPLWLLAVIAAASAVWTAARYADFWPLNAVAPLEWWVNVAGVTARLALKRAVLASAAFFIVPGVFCMAYEVLSDSACAGAAPWRRVIWLVACGLALPLAAALYQHSVDPTFCMLNEPAWSTFKRVSGGFTDPNAFGVFLGMFVPLAALAAWRERGLRQMAFIAAVLLALYGIMLSGSRSALLALGATAAALASAVLAALARRARLTVQVIGGAAVALLLCALLVPLVFSSALASRAGSLPLVNRLVEFVARSQESPDASLFDRRETQWRQALAVWSDFPVSGIGLGAFPTEVANYSVQAVNEAPMDNAWNQYLQWGAELGLAGLALALWAIVAYAVIVVRAARRAPAGAVDWQVFWVVGATLAALHFSFIFGAHLQAAEVACLYAVLAALLLSQVRPAASLPPEREMRPLAFIVAAVLIIGAQGETAYAWLSRSAVRERHGLPHEFGLYQQENWQGMFTYRWTGRYAGRQVTVPPYNRVLVLKVLDADPGTSAARPKQVGLWLDHMFINTFLITNAAWQELEAYVYDCAAGPATLLIRCDRVWHAPGDPRALGIALNDEVSWRTEFNGSAQGLSAWHANTEGAGPAHYRWTEQNAALRVAVPDSDRITLAMRVPARVPFYRTRVSVDVFIDGKFCRRVALPRSPARWVHESFIVDQQLRGQRALLSLKVSRLSTVRAAGAFSGARAGIALAVE